MTYRDGRDVFDEPDAPLNKKVSRQKHTSASQKHTTLALGSEIMFASGG